MRLGIAVCAASLAAWGATLERMSLEEMASLSTAIVRARAVSSSSAYVGSSIYTRTRFQVLERWKGPEGAEVEVFEPGGTAGGVTQRFTGVPRFTPGQEVVLFLWTGPSGRTQVIGLSQGVFQVERSAAGEAQVTREASAEPLIAPGTRVLVRDEPVRMRLENMALRVRGALQRNRTQ